MRKSKVNGAVLVAAWCAVGGASLWSISALADGIERPRQQVTEAEPPEYPELLGGPEEPQAPAPVEPVVLAEKPPIVAITSDCITFEEAHAILGKLDTATIEDVDAFIRDLQRDLGDDEWCEGVRETIKIVLTPEPPPPPEEPEPPVLPPGGEPPGGPGGPGYQ